MIITTRLFSITLAILTLWGCGGGDSETTPPNSAVPPIISPPVAMITVSGQVSEIPLISANVTVRDLENRTLAIGVTDTEGRFSLSVIEADIKNGYLIESSGGELSGAEFKGIFKATYSATDSYNKANATIVTTLISELVLLDGNSTLVERRDNTIALLSNIGLFAASEWNNEEPDGVELFSLHADIANDGFSTVMNSLIADLQDKELNVNNMRYFPMAYGGITYFSLTETENRISGFPGSTLTDRVIILGTKDAPNYQFSIIEGPTGLDISDDGILSFLLEESEISVNDINFKIKATHPETGLGRELNGSFYPMPSETFVAGIVGPQGGTLREPVNGIEIVIPAGSVESEVTITILRGVDAQENVTFEVRSTGIVGDIQVYLPNAELFGQIINNELDTESKSLNMYSANLSENTNKADSPRYLWSTQYDWFKQGDRIGRKYTQYWNGLGLIIAKAKIASLLSCLEPLDSAELKGKTPVLFIHGYSLKAASAFGNEGPDGKDLGNLGGGEGTWGSFPTRVAELTTPADSFLSCEFQWDTDARFQVVAEDLRRAAELIVQKTGKEAHIIAHSFGGILARTYLQGLASNPFFQGFAYERPIASLTTLGTPHSGIADSDEKTMFNIKFPDGQDGDWKFNSVSQISAYQMGESISSLPLIGLSSFKSALELEKDEGFIAAAISATYEDTGKVINQFPDMLPIQVLIGINTAYQCTDRDIPGITIQGCIRKAYVAGEGDGLITYSGQRFHPALSLSGMPEPLLTPLSQINKEYMLGANVVEHILGTDKTVLIGEAVTLDPLEGYRHDVFNGSSSDGLREAYVACEEILVGEDNVNKCDWHDGFRRVRLWLENTPSEEVSSFYEDLNDETTTDIFITASEIQTARIGAGLTKRALVSVVDQNGVPLERLTQGNFSLSETVNGEINGVPIISASLQATNGTAIVIAIDRSGSMGPSFNNDIVAAKAAAKTFVENMGPEDQATIIDFAGEVVIQQEFTRDKTLLQSAIDNVNVGRWNGTAAYDAAFEGLELTKNIFGRKAVVLLTDGADLSSRRSIEEVTSLALELGVPVYTIGLNVVAGSREENALIQISNNSNAGVNGSGYFAAPTTAQLDKLYSTILQLLSSAYSITWPSSGLSGDLVNVEISVEYKGKSTFTNSTVKAYVVP
jgi:pimeloyl-ACP methyl ester carboxylesterase